MPEFIAISLRIGPLMTGIVANEVVLLDRAVMPLAASARMTGKYLGPRTRHDGIDRHLLHGEFPGLAEHRRAEPSDDLVRRMARALEHRLDARLRRQHDRKHVRPVVLLEQPLEVVFGIGLHQPRRRSLERQALEIRILERRRQAVEHLLHEGASRDRRRCRRCTHADARPTDRRPGAAYTPDAGAASPWTARSPCRAARIVAYVRRLRERRPLRAPR